jgi:hypothetical protein
MKIEPPSRRQREVPAELDRIVMKALERARDARPARAAELARDLQAWLAAAAPSLTREDVGAFVQEVVPRSDATEPVALGLAHAPTLLTPSATGEKVPLSSSLPQPTPTVADAGETRVGKRNGSGSQPASATVKQRRSPVGWIVGGVGLALLGGGGGFALWRSLHGAGETAAAVDGGGLDAAGLASSADGGAAVVVPEAERVRMVAELEALPQAGATWRGVADEGFLAIMSALDGALCATPVGAKEPVLADAARARLDAQKLMPETLAVWRYLAATGTLPPRVAVAVQAFLRTHAAWSSSGSPQWSVARLGALTSPEDAKTRLAVVRQNGALAAWREPGRDRVLPFPELCERAAAVEAYARREPGIRAEALRRFLRATPPEMPADDGGLRWTVTGGERDEAAASLLVRVRITNTSGEDKALPLSALRLAGLEVGPSADPPADRLGAGQVRELRLSWTGITDDVAEAAVLVVRAGVELQAYSEALR